MTDINPSMVMDISPVGFQTNDDWETQPFIRCSLFVSEFTVKIQLVSHVIDAAKVVFTLIENDIYVRERISSVTKSEAVIERLSLWSDEPFFLSLKPLLPTKDVFTHCDNSYEIWFRDCDEYAVCEVYDRLIYAMGSICDFFVANMILANIKDLVQNTNPVFSTAKIDRLLGCKSPAFEQSISDLSNLCNIGAWSVSIPVAKGIFDSLKKQIEVLVMPSAAIESLTSDLTEREKCVIENRGLKALKTFEELGSELGITRERVRQIASKVETRFRTSRSKVNLIKGMLYSLQVLCECEYCFTARELDKFKVSVGTLTFLSEVLEDKYKLAYVSETDCIAICGKDGKCEWLEHIDMVTGSIPSLLLPDEQQSIVKAISSSLEELGYIIPVDIIATIAFRKYIKNGSILVKKSLRMGDRYELVLEKFFPDGIRIYQAEDMRLFRKGYNALFNDDKIPDNDHAVVSRVTDRCVLIDRGTYILNKRTDLPAKLSRRLLDFIVEYPFDMVMTNAIMHRFRSELTAIGVDNKYYLLSVLKQHFGDKFSFRRDYVIKGENNGNFYGNITGFVELHPDGVSFQDLQANFRGISDAVLNIALLEDDSIIPMYNKMYIHKSNIIFPEQRQVLGLLQEVVSQEHIISDVRAYGLLRRDFPDFIADNNINTSWYLFSILRSFFPDEFKFSRPHIIDLSFDSANGREALRGSFWGRRYVDIADIKSFAKEKQIQIYDFSKLLDSYSDRYFIFNKERLISIDEIGYGPDEFSQVEDIVIEALGSLEYCEIAKLNVVNALPKAHVTLTEWIIYSIINKYGTQLSATTSTSQFMNSVPLVFRNSIDIETVRGDYASSDAADQTVRIDDLSDIDSLVEGIIDFELFCGEKGK